MVGYPSSTQERIRAPFAGKLLGTLPSQSLSLLGVGERPIRRASGKEYSAKSNFAQTVF